MQVSNGPIILLNTTEVANFFLMVLLINILGF